MPYKEGQPLLMGFLAGIPLGQVVRKKLFGKRYITMFHYAATLAFQYETGALLGRAMRDKLDIFHKILVKPGTDINRSIAFIQSEAKNLIKNFIEEEGKEPDTFYDFIALKELENASKVTGLSMVSSKDFRKLYGHEFVLDDVYRNILSCGLHGLGFGSSFPELTVRMYKNSHEINMREKITREPYFQIYEEIRLKTGADPLRISEWAEARSRGEEPDIIPLEEREKEILAMVADYTGEYYPELLDPLDLRGYLTLNNRQSKEKMKMGLIGWLIISAVLIAVWEVLVRIIPEGWALVPVNIFCFLASSAIGAFGYLPIFRRWMKYPLALLCAVGLWVVVFGVIRGLL